MRMCRWLLLGFLLGGAGWGDLLAAVPAEAPAVASKSKGAALALDMISQIPDQSSQVYGVLRVYPAPRKTNEFQMRFAIDIKDGRWLATYDATNAAGREVHLAVTHTPGGTNHYELTEKADAAAKPVTRTLAGAETMVPFADSDFWIADFGLEFFHWPDQSLLKTEMRRSRSCYILESKQPKPAPGGYSKVISSIHVESGGIVQAEAYDATGTQFKLFEPSKVEKISGVYQLKEMKISNEKTHSRSVLTFDLENK